MKPKRIILIRHGESEANVNRYLFGSVPDYTIELTQKGRQQALEAGHRLKKLVAILLCLTFLARTLDI